LYYAFSHLSGQLEIESLRYIRTWVSVSLISVNNERSH
jgi:hypothetical protein